MLPFNHVLLVDDDLLSNLINEKTIRLSNFAENVESYLNANEALGYLKRLLKKDRTRFPGIVFLDNHMPEMDGWEFIRELNKFPDFIIKDCKVFMLSSTLTLADMEYSKMFNMEYRFISKPLTPVKLDLIFSLNDEPLNVFV